MARAAAISAAALLLYWAAAQAGQTHHVRIEAMKFVPPRIEVNVGDRIVWTNHDFLPHSVTAASRSIESGDLAQNGQWTLTARQKGELAYICRLHPGMKALVIVK